MTIPNQSTQGSANGGQITLGLIDHLLDCLFSNNNPNAILIARLGTLVQDLELFKPPKILAHDENLKFINLRAKFQRLRAEKLKERELQDVKICHNSKSLNDRLMPLIEHIFSLPGLPKDIWKNHILPTLLQDIILLPIKVTLGKIQVDCQMSKLVKQTMLQVMESEHYSLRITGCKTVVEAINFVIRHKLASANLTDFPDLTNEHLKTLAEKCPQLNHLLIASHNLTEFPTFTALQSLTLRGCYNLTDEGIAQLKELKALQSLNLSQCKNLTGAGLAQLKGLTALQSLDLSYCKLTDTGLAHLKELTALQSLNLAGNRRLTDEGIAQLEGVTALQSLTLYGCYNLTDEGIAQLKELKALESLRIINYLKKCDTV